jgi:hypothetical protein
MVKDALGSSPSDVISASRALGVVGGIGDVDALDLGRELVHALLKAGDVSDARAGRVIGHDVDRGRQRHPGRDRHGLHVRQVVARGADLQLERDRRGLLEVDARLLLPQGLVELRAPGNAETAGHPREAERNGPDHDAR